MAWGASSSTAVPPSPGASPATAKAVIPRERAPGVVRANRVYTSASGALEIQALVPVSRNPSPSGSARSSSPPASDPASGSDRAKAATARPAATSASHRPRTAGLPAAAIGCAPSPWRASAVSASVDSRASASRSRHSSSADAPGPPRSAGEQPGEQAVLAEGGDQRPVDPPRPPGRGQRDQHLPGQRPHLAHQPFLGGAERERPGRIVGHAPPPPPGPGRARTRPRGARPPEGTVSDGELRCRWVSTAR